ncbi:long-chain fatty alcohol dehydrogenase [Piedraia hortae CBS 480.64]|uniref:Long-chain-alcohol oxidase n=1 Tax=Piedraia hortae CBS 480.64 TaxID=1314780 RepID=A0A6A7BV94_9PEZI|nr:long-chain fatty alcohol dehydrogenase [Piedraia hortae CBS 480.64]
MADEQQETIRQTPSPLPALSTAHPLSADQWRVLCAIADTVLPSLPAPSGSDAIAKRYWAEKATSSPEFVDSLTRLLNHQLNRQAKRDLILILSTLNTRAGALFLTGHVTPIDRLSLATREKILQSWASARLPAFRALHCSLTSLGRLTWLRTSSALGPALGYPRTPVHDPRPKETFDFEFHKFESGITPAELETDVVIVGSGCGGAVAAKTLAEAGLRVIVVDQSYHWTPDHLPMNEQEGVGHLFLNGGVLSSDDNSIAMFAGSAWGGGGTVNWSASLQTQGYVRREWAGYGLSRFTDPDFQADMDAVCARMGAGLEAVEHNYGNRVLLEGARRLGWTAKPVPQNTGGAVHNCGYCTLGCGSGGKKGPTETFLPDAARQGAIFIEGFEVDRILFDRHRRRGDRIASGIQGMWTGRDASGGVSAPDRPRRPVTIRSHYVVASAGSLSTPPLLLRSGLTNPHIGRHLRLHPVSFCAAVWDEDVRPWEGSILTSVVSEFENLDGSGHGTKLEATNMLPSIFLPIFPWHDGAQWKEFCLKMRHMTGYISLVRDRNGGRVYVDPVDGRTRIQYNPGALDRSHVLEGIARLAELLYVEGAREIHTTIATLEPFVRPTGAVGTPSTNDADFQAWLAKLRSMGFPSPGAPFASAHQMGSCRMGISPSNSVVDPRGRVWGCQGLYICDASAFPSASGVNPMITNMGMSRGTARGIAEDFFRATKGKL